MSVEQVHTAPKALAETSREALQLIAEGVTEIVGFGVAAIGLVNSDVLETVAVAGTDDVKQGLLGSRSPLQSVLDELAAADDWGLFKFVPHERLLVGPADWGWVPDIEPIDAPDAWHPLDLLAAPLHGDDGVLRGLLSIDMPEDGLRPGPAKRRLLERYAAQAVRAVGYAMEREELAEQVRLAETARMVVRRAAGQRTLDEVLEQCRDALVRGFRAGGMWIQTFDEDGLGTGAIHANDGSVVELPSHLVEVAEMAARLGWKQQLVQVVHRGRAIENLSEDQVEEICDFLESIEVGSILFVPLGAGDECLGNLVLTRPVGAREWTSTEAAAALDIGADLGTAILHVRAFEREHRLVAELRALDTYRSQLIATVSHELKNPLTAILGHLEILESEELPAIVQSSLSAMGRGARRLESVVEDLLLLSRVADSVGPVDARPVDLRRTVDDVLDMVSVEVQRKHLTVRVDARSTPILASGDPDDLDRVLGNLVSNAVKYTPEGGAVTVTLEHSGAEVLVAVADEGIGISAEDQRHLFTEFYRSSNPVAVTQPGTGLGLAIARRIVARHGGRIEVESTLGSGSTFRVFLPAA